MAKESEVLFATPFPEGVVPVVMTEIHKPTNVKAPMVTKVWDITNKGFKCQIVIEAAATTVSTRYNVNYMAITPGVGTVDKEAGLMIAAGRNEGTMYGTSQRPNYFKHNEESLFLTSPYIFANLQTKNYDAATIVRKRNRYITEEVDGIKRIVGAYFKRIVDAGKKTASDGTTLNQTKMKDDLGWVVLYTQEKESSDPTNIGMMEAAETLRPYAVNGVIYVDGHDTFEVYSTSGVKLNPNQPQLPGVYVVRIANATAMVVVK